jgi:hypothetical protein
MYYDRKINLQAHEAKKNEIKQKKAHTHQHEVKKRPFLIFILDQEYKKITRTLEQKGK